MASSMWNFEMKYLENWTRYLQTVNGVRLVFVGSFISDQLSFWVNFPFWLKRFETFCVASDIKNTTQKRSLLLYMAGPKVMDIFETLAETGEDSDYKTTHGKLTEHFSPHKNTEFQRYCFRQSQQAESETSFIHDYENSQKIVTFMMWILK